MEDKVVSGPFVEHENRIGNLNGKWSVLFRSLLSVGAIVLPMMVMLNVWFVTAIYEVKITQVRLMTELQSFASAGPRYTPDMALAAHLELQKAIIEQIKHEYPPPWLQKQVDENTRHIQMLEHSDQ